MADRLTEAQRAHLQAIAAEEGRSSYPRLNLRVIYSLEIRGLVRGDHTMPGCFSSPQTAVQWFTTPAGRRALQSGGDE